MKRGQHNPITAHFANAMWSFDGASWFQVPFSIRGDVSLEPSLCLLNGMRLQIESYLASGVDEPIAHVLRREASEQQFGGPRSAMAIAAVAVEVGVKRCIAILAPDADWLLTNLPAPPVHRLIGEYLRKLPSKDNRTSRHPVPADLVSDIRNGFNQRNELIHRGKEPERDNLKKFLAAVNDLLWLLDYYSGEDWAIEYVSSPTLAAMGLAAIDTQ